LSHFLVTERVYDLFPLSEDVVTRDEERCHWYEGRRDQTKKLEANRCTRIAREYPFYCDEHAPTVYTKVRVGASLIPNAGKGLFARVPLEEDTVLSFYHGVHSSTMHTGDYVSSYIAYPLFLANTSSAAALSISVDARATQTCIARYANSSKGRSVNDGDVPPKERPNCVTIPEDVAVEHFGGKWQHLALKTARDIEAGEELTWWYGEGYHMDASLVDGFTLGESFGPAHAATTFRSNGYFSTCRPSAHAPYQVTPPQMAWWLQWNLRKEGALCRQCKK